MTPKLLIGLVILCSARRAVAERAIEVEVTFAAPFDRAELVAAIRVRLGPDGVPVRVRVTPSDTGVRVEARGGVRDVVIAGLTGPDAARLVALAANDLLLDDLATPPELDLEPPSATGAAVGPDSATSVGVLGAVAGWDGLLGGITADIAMPRGPWLIAVDFGGATLVDGPVNLSSAVVRLSGGVRSGWFEVRAGATLAPLVVSNGAGDRTVLVGGGASARVRVPVSQSVRVLVAGGVDAFATRTEYRFAGMDAFATPRWAPWIALGMEMTP